MYNKLIEATRAGCDHRQAALRAIDISCWNSWMGSVSFDSCVRVFDRQVRADAQQPSSGRLLSQANDIVVRSASMFSRSAENKQGISE